jgi:hypothetical protein
MRALAVRFRDVYGSRPLQLLLMLAGFAVLGYVIATIKPQTLWNPHVWWQSIAVWFAGAVVFHDLVLFPMYALADRLLTLPAERRQRQPRVPAINYIRVPTLGSALTFLLFLPGIIKQGAPTYVAATGQTQEVFLGRWLALTAAMFAASAIAYVVSAALNRRRG